MRVLRRHWRRAVLACGTALILAGLGVRENGKAHQSHWSAQWRAEAYVHAYGHGPLTTRRRNGSHPAIINAYAVEDLLRYPIRQLRLGAGLITAGAVLIVVATPWPIWRGK